METAARAGISSQYLSEIERGRKDASSEVLAAVAGALDLDLRRLAVEVIRDDEAVNSTRLVTGEVMGAITSDPLAIRGTTLRPLGTMRYLPVATPEFRDLWMPRGVDDAALAKAPMVQFDRNDDIQANVLASLVAEPSSPPKTYIPASSEYARAIELGMGWGAVPHVQAADALGFDGVLLPTGGTTQPRRDAAVERRSMPSR